jgi:hypothetical protein
MNYILCDYSYLHAQLMVKILGRGHKISGLKPQIHDTMTSPLFTLRMRTSAK